MQGIEWRSHSDLLRAIHNAADGSLRLALRVKIDEKYNRLSSDLIIKKKILIYFHASGRYYPMLARVGGFHRQGTSGRSYSELCFALNNAAYGSLRRALRVKIDEK